MLLKEEQIKWKRGEKQIEWKREEEVAARGGAVEMRGAGGRRGAARRSALGLRVVALAVLVGFFFLPNGLVTRVRLGRK